MVVPIHRSPIQAEGAHLNPLGHGQRALICHAFRRWQADSMVG